MSLSRRSFLGSVSCCAAAALVPFGAVGRAIPFQAFGAIPESDIINVKLFGACGDGIADDTVPIQAAIDWATGAGGTVYFPAGTYRVASQIRTMADKMSGAPA